MFTWAGSWHVILFQQIWCYEKLAGKSSSWSLLWQERLPGVPLASPSQGHSLEPRVPLQAPVQDTAVGWAVLYPCQLQADDSWQAGIWLVAFCRALWPYLLSWILLYPPCTHASVSHDVLLLRRTDARWEKYLSWVYVCFKKKKNIKKIVAWFGNSAGSGCVCHVLVVLWRPAELWRETTSLGDSRRKLGPPGTSSGIWALSLP